jgi:hypothetical protein
MNTNLWTYCLERLILRRRALWIRERFRRGSVAQLVEQRPFKALVPGSSPGRPIAQPLHYSHTPSGQT